MICSKSFLISCVIFLAAGCSSHVPLLEDFDGAIIRSRALKESYQELSWHESQVYLRYLGDRIALGSHSGISPSIVILKTGEPLAFSPGGGEIIVSSGLIQALGSEAEFAFIIAHEFAHQLLDHSPPSAPEDGAADGELAWQEEQADRYALDIIAFAGYDPRAAEAAIFDAYRRSRVDGSEDSHPSLQRRVQLIKNAIALSGWRPPGIVDRFDFRRLRAALTAAL